MGLSYLGHIPVEALWLGAATMVAGLAVPLLDHLNTAYHRARLRRRLARDEYILQSEYREYQMAIGGDPPPLLPATRSAAIAAAGAGALVWVADWASDWGEAYGLEDPASVAIAAWGAVVAARSLWRIVNDPEDSDSEEEADPRKRRRDAWLGLASAAALLIFAAWMGGFL